MRLWIDALAADLPELPDAKRARFMADYGLSAYDASILVAERETADFFEEAVKHGGAKRDAKAVANWLMGDIAAQANTQGVAVADAGMSRRVLGCASSISSARASSPERSPRICW